jgi:hypothetical protein
VSELPQLGEEASGSAMGEAFLLHLSAYSFSRTLFQRVNYEPVKAFEEGTH